MRFASDQQIIQIELVTESSHVILLLLIIHFVSFFESYIIYCFHCFVCQWSYATHNVRKLNLYSSFSVLIGSRRSIFWFVNLHYSTSFSQAVSQFVKLYITYFKCLINLTKRNALFQQQTKQKPVCCFIWFCTPRANTVCKHIHWLMHQWSATRKARALIM